jgi:hypothetical protein
MENQSPALEIYSFPNSHSSSLREAPTSLRPRDEEQGLQLLSRQVTRPQPLSAHDGACWLLYCLCIVSYLCGSVIHLTFSIVFRQETLL